MKNKSFPNIDVNRLASTRSKEKNIYDGEVAALHKLESEATLQIVTKKSAKDVGTVIPN